MGTEWVREEFSDIQLGDKRITRAMKKWKDAKAAYRLFDNDKVTEEKIMDSHVKRSKERIKASNKQTILCLQDTSEICYTHHPGIKLGHGRSGKGNTLLMHAMLGVSAEGVPLGLLHQDLWYRKEIGVAKYRTDKPIEQKESYLVDSFLFCLDKTAIN